MVARLPSTNPDNSVFSIANGILTRNLAEEFYDCSF